MRPLSLHGAEPNPLRYKDIYDSEINKERMDYVPNNPNYSDLLHPSAFKSQPEQYSRTPIDYNMNINAICPVDLDPLSNILPFPGTQAYKEFSVFKEKNPQELADALLSLKHAVIHPAQLASTQLSPLSPSYNMNHQSNHQQQYMSNYATTQYPQFPESRNFAEFSPFPSMSVNVSMQMNMNMGVSNQQLNQWSPAHQQFSQSGTGQYSASYSANNQGYQASYSFSSDIRNLAQEREQRFAERSKYYTRRQKMSVQRMELADNTKMNLCRICGKTYARPSTLKTHMRTHSGEKPYRCTTCSKSFSQAANLTAHIRTHSGEKPFRCLICERRFSQSSSVTTHMRTHSGERPYRCRMCNKAFSDSSTLTKHLRIHSGEKPYKCELCLLRFSQSGNLNRHMRVHANSS